MAFIPEDKLLEIKDAASLEEVVGQHVKLTQRGKNLVGLCPFHADTTPSFTVAPDKGIFHCFGCGAGGNIFSFLMQYHRLSFPEAVQELARRYGIPLQFKDLGPEGGKQARKRQAFYEIHTLAAAFYQTTLQGAAGKAGREYLAKRGLTPEVIQAYNLGYAPDGWDALARHLQNRGISLETAQEVGLVLPRTHGGFYDRFRNRVMFPITDRQGRVIAFGGRVVGPGEPKYLNSPESPLYSKGRNLYGILQAQEALRESGVALLVEGYLDLLALKVHGIANVLATLGTALTREQVRLLKSLTSQVVLVYDGDAAGARAMQRAFPLFAQEGLAVRVLPLPAGMDPDSYAFTHGVELFRSPWEAAQPWFSYLLEELIKAHGLEIEGRVRIIEELRPYFQTMAEVERGLWLRATSERLQVEEATLKRSLTSQAPILRGRLDPAGRVAINMEKKLLKLILCCPTAIPPEELEEWAAEFEDTELKEIMALVIRCCQEHGSLDHSLLIQQVEGEALRQQICALTLAEEEFSGPAAYLLAADARLSLKIRRLERTHARLKERLETAASDPDGEDLSALLIQHQEIDRQLAALKMRPTAKGESG